MAVLTSHSVASLASASPRFRKRRGDSPTPDAAAGSSQPQSFTSEAARIFSSLHPSSFGEHGGLHPDAVRARIEPPCAQCGMAGPETLITCPCCARDVCSQECLGLHEKGCWALHFPEAAGFTHLPDFLSLTHADRVGRYTDERRGQNARLIDIGRQATDFYLDDRELLPHVQSRATKAWLSVALDVPENLVRYRDTGIVVPREHAFTEDDRRRTVPHDPLRSLSNLTYPRHTLSKGPAGR